MHTIIQKNLFLTQTFTITEEGLLVSKKTVWRNSKELIPFNDIGTELKALTKEFHLSLLILFSYSIVFLLLFSLTLLPMIERILLSSLIAGIIFVFFINYFSFHELRGIKNIMFIPDNPNKTEYDKFIKNLTDTVEKLQYYHETDEIFGDDFCERFLDILRRHCTGELNETEFFWEKARLTWEYSHQYFKPGNYPN